MRILAEIIEDVKSGKEVSTEELKYSLLVYEFMFSMDHRNLRESLISEKVNPLVNKLRADNSFNMLKNALNKSPKEYLGWNNDPDNPEYQKRRKIGLKIIDKITKA
jgi:hypothetical protein